VERIPFFLFFFN
jgi:hypothetical protein